MTPKTIGEEFSQEQFNPQEKLKSAIEESLLYAIKDTKSKKDFFERFLFQFKEIHPDHAGEEYKSKYNDLLNLRNEVEFIEEDLESGACETKEEAIKRFFDDGNVKESLGF